MSLQGKYKNQTQEQGGVSGPGNSLHPPQPSNASKEPAVLSQSLTYHMLSRMGTRDWAQLSTSQFTLTSTVRKRQSHSLELRKLGLRNGVVSLRSHSKQVTEPGFNPGLPTPKLVCDVQRLLTIKATLRDGASSIRPLPSDHHPPFFKWIWLSLLLLLQSLVLKCWCIY